MAGNEVLGQDVPIAYIRHQKPAECVQSCAKNVQNAKDVKSAKNIQKQSTSAPTVVFGLLGVIIGVIALVFGYISPDRMISLFSPNPQLLTAIICAVVGLILVIVAVVWAIVGAVKKRKQGLRVKMCVWLGVSRGLDLAFLNAD